MDLSYKRFFGTLANENRLRVVRYLAARGPRNVSAIVRGTGLEQTAVSHNLRRLLSCQFVHCRERGRERVYSVNARTIKPLVRLLDTHVEQYCRRSCPVCRL